MKQSIINQIVKIVIAGFLAITPASLFALEIVAEGATQVYDNYRGAIDNGKNPQEASKEAVTNTYIAQSWEKGSVSKGLLIAEAGVNLIETLTGEDGLSTVRDIMHSTNVDLISDNHATSDRTQIVGGALYGLGHVAGHFEDKNKERDNEYFLEQHKEERKKDKYWNCRYKIDPNSGRYINVQQQYGMATVMQCIREKEQAEAREVLEEALLQCNPWYSVEDLEELISSDDLNTRNKGLTIKQNALKCYYESQKEQSENFDDEITTSPIASGKTTTNNEIGSDSIQTEQISNYGNDTKNGEAGGENKTSQTNETKSMVKTSVLTDKELLEQIKVNQYRLDSFRLSEDNKESLDKAAEVLMRNKDISIILLGHTCNIGEDSVNYCIGILRAKAAKKYLVEKGIEARRISIQSAGSKKPIASNATPSGRATNRRVEIIINE